MLLFGAIAVLTVALTGLGLAIVQGRKTEMLIFRCTHCAAEFRQRAHLDFPAKCPSCGRTDWATR